MNKSNKIPKNIYFSIYAQNDHTTSVYARNWPPLCFLNCIAILRENGYQGTLIASNQLDPLPSGSTIILSSGPIDKWFVPSIRLNKFFDLCQTLSSKHHIYITGIHATLFPEMILKKTKAKGILPGMPEMAVEHFCKIGEWGGYSWNSKKKIIGMSRWPIPAYDQISAKNYYFEPMGWKNFGVFEISRGCNQNCQYCAKRCLYGNIDDHKSAKNIVDDLCAAIGANGFETGYFMDICFLTNRAVIEDFCRIFLEKGLHFHWACETKMDALDDDLLDLMYDAGCRMIGMGICSFFDLQGQNQFDKDKYADKIALIEKKGIRTLGYFIVSPFFTSPTSADSQVFEALKQLPLTFANVRRYLDLENTKWLYDELQKEEDYKQDHLDRIIKRNLLLFYLNPFRLIKIVRQVGITKLLRSLWFFIKFLLRK